MRGLKRWTFLIVAGMGVCAGSAGVEAADPEISVTVAPVRYIAVNGDAGTFREHHWMKDGYVGGISDFSGKYTLPDGAEFTTEGHALIDQNDLGAAFSLKKESLGFVDLDFTEFRKYYSGKAGVFRRFGPLSSPDTDKQLQLDLGKLELETGLTLDGWPELTFGYEREYKDGTKSRLTWGEVEESVSGTKITKNITPSWQEIDERVDVFTLGATHQLAGIDLTGEQRWEFVRSENLRQELDLSTTHDTDDDKIRRHAQSPESTFMTTLLGAERSFQEGNTVLASAYRFGHMDNREFENIYEIDSETGIITNFDHAEQIRNARADNDYDSHTWVASSSVKLAEALNLTTKLKAEMIRLEGSSTYPADDSPEPGVPDGVIDEIELNRSDSKANRWGEGVGLRYTGIPRTALYTELELEQARVLLREIQSNMITPSVSLSRETVVNVRRGAWVLGGNFAPWSVLNFTTHVRHRRNNNDYDDQRETSFSSAFIDMQNIHTNEFMTRATYRPRRWLRTAFRYTYRDDDYSTAVQSQQIVKTGMQSHTYTYDTSLQLLRDLILTGSFSRQTAWTTTPGRYGSGDTNIPTFNSDVNSWLLSADYTPRQDLVLNGTLQHSRARNFNDFSVNGLPQGGMPYGADFDQIDVTTGLTWSPKEDTSLSAEYGFYYYQPNSNWNAGDYDAHLISFEVSQKF